MIDLLSFFVSLSLPLSHSLVLGPWWLSAGWGSGVCSVTRWTHFDVTRTWKRLLMLEWYSVTRVDISDRILLTGCSMFSTVFMVMAACGFLWQARFSLPNAPWTIGKKIIYWFLHWFFPWMLAIRIGFLHCSWQYFTQFILASHPLYKIYCFFHYTSGPQWTFLTGQVGFLGIGKNLRTLRDTPTLAQIIPRSSLTHRYLAF